MDKDWASRHVTKPVQFRDRPPTGPRRKPWGKILGVLLAIGIAASAVAAWKMGLLDAYLTREATDDAAAPTAQPPIDPPTTLNSKQREAIQRGIAVQTRRRTDHESRAAALETQITHATAKLYPPNGSPKVDYETYLRNEIRSARSSQNTGLATTLELQLGDYHRKLQELRTKLAHERDIIASCTKLIDQEQAKLIP